MCKGYQNLVANILLRQDSGASQQVFELFFTVLVLLSTSCGLLVIKLGVSKPYALGFFFPSTFLQFASFFSATERFSDYAKGFGGKYGVEEDRRDKSAVGWEDHEKLHQHESQTGIVTVCTFLLLFALFT